MLFFFPLAFFQVDKPGLLSSLPKLSGSLPLSANGANVAFQFDEVRDVNGHVRSMIRSHFWL
jgi:hypothetical protein